MSVVLITGINSGIGQSLAKNLSKDFSIIGTLRSAEGKSADYCEELVPFSAEARLAVSRPVDIIIHTAGAHPRAKKSPELRDYINSNVLMVDQLLKFAVSHEVKQLIYLSTNDLDEIDEPSDIYAVSKKMGEVLMKEFDQEGLSLLSLRLPGVISREDPPRSFLSRSLKKIEKSEPLDVFSADLPFSFTDTIEVANVVRAFIEQPPKVFTEFSLSADEPLTLREILQEMKKSTGSTSLISTNEDGGVGSPLMRERQTQWPNFVPSKSSEILARFLSRS